MTMIDADIVWRNEYTVARQITPLVSLVYGNRLSSVYGLQEQFGNKAFPKTFSKESWKETQWFVLKEPPE
jgi:hypothetical protein